MARILSTIAEGEDIVLVTFFLRVGQRLPPLNDLMFLITVFARIWAVGFHVRRTLGENLVSQGINIVLVRVLKVNNLAAVV